MDSRDNTARSANRISNLALGLDPAHFQDVADLIFGQIGPTAAIAAVPRPSRLHLSNGRKTDTVSLSGNGNWLQSSKGADCGGLLWRQFGPFSFSFAVFAVQLILRIGFPFQMVRINAGVVPTVT